MSKKETVKAIREAFKDATDTDLQLTDDVIYGIVTKREDWDELDDEAKIEALKAAVEIAESVKIVDPTISVLVSKIDDRFEDEITTCVAAIMKGKTTAVDIYAEMRRVFTKSELDSTPVPGTEKEHVTGNAKPDVVKTVDQTGKKITTVWWNDFVSKTGRGKQYEDMIDLVKKEQKNPGTTSMKNRGKSELASELSTATAQRNAVRSMFKRAAALHHQFSKVEGMPLVGIKWIAGKPSDTVMPAKYGKPEGKTVTSAPKPLWIYPKDEYESGRDFSVTQLLAFDVPLALANGGTMAKLVETAGSGKEEEAGKVNKLTVDEVEGELPDLVSFFEDRANMATVLKKLNTKDPADSDDFRATICSLYLILKPVYLKNQSRYEAYLKAQGNEAEADAIEEVEEVA